MAQSDGPTQESATSSEQNRFGSFAKMAQQFEAIVRIDRFFRKSGKDLKPVEPRATVGSYMNRQVFIAEVDEILGSRDRRGIPTGGLDESLETIEALEVQEDSTIPREKQSAGREPWAPPVSANLVGLALSGGGIRSATFCLGALQVLGERGVLRHIDYLSTVSGGGYIGSFWTCFLARSKIGDKLLAQAEEKDADGNICFQCNPLYKLRHVEGLEEPVSFQRLRNYANYLLVGGWRDAIRGPALLLRGLFINFLMVLPYVLLLSALTAFFFEVQIAENLYGSSRVAYLPLPIWGWAFGAAFFVVVVLSAIVQSAQQYFGKANVKSRKTLFRVNVGIVMVALAIIWMDVQPKLIHALYFEAGSGSNDPASNGALWELTTNGELWSLVTAVLGPLSAILAGLTASRSTEIKAKLALAAVGILVPLSFLFLYFLLAAWAVFGVPEVLADFWPAAQTFLGAYEPWQIYFAAGLALLVITLSFDVNATSLHNYYRDSLSRTFLFSIHERDGGKVIIDEDQIKLSTVDVKKSGGPYHLLNAAVNNPDLEEDALRGRRSDFFVFGPAYSGNNRLGYSPTEKLENTDRNADLGTALAVSAAAVAPNMGEKTNPFAKFLMAMLNLRLGYWLPSPKAAERTRLWKTVGPLYFFQEMIGFGIAPGEGRYHVNLSDGGHIENLGIFELLRRRCKYIISIDSEADPELTFNGLATLIRLARTDMGIDIDIDVEDLRKGDEGLSRRHWVLGRINYGKDANGNELHGELLYVKSSITGSENEYITEYRARHPNFPHQTTADQFFDEVQFEAYRALGYKVGDSMFPVEAAPVIDQIFSKLREHDTGAIRRHRAHFDLLDRRRSIDGLLADPSLQAYAKEIAPKPEAKSGGVEASGPEPDLPKPPTFKLHQVCNAQLQLMERALIALQLDDPRNRRRHSNRGWMNLFRRWGQAPTFRMLWAVNIPNYSSALQDFCQQELNLSLKAEWSVERGGGRGVGAGVSRLVAVLSAIHSDDADGPIAKYRVAEAKVEKSGEQGVLTEFSLSAPYKGVGLRELLFKELRENPILGDRPSFDLERVNTLEFERTVRALLRCHFRARDPRDTEMLGQV